MNKFFKMFRQRNTATRSEETTPALLTEDAEPLSYQPPKREIYESSPVIFDALDHVGGFSGSSYKRDYAGEPGFYGNAAVEIAKEEMRLPRANRTLAEYIYQRYLRKPQADMGYTPAHIRDFYSRLRIHGITADFEAVAALYPKEL